jgi:bacterial/archaeal transporter family-2 protein
VSGGAALAAVLAALAGIAGSVQVAVMGRFGERIGVFAAFLFASILGTLIGLIALLGTNRSLDGLAAGLRAPPWLWLGGVLGAFIVLTITVAAPRIGTTATIGLLIAGQLAMGVVIDRYGLFGLERIAVSWPRLLGIVLLAAGAALSLHKAA